MSKKSQPLPSFIHEELVCRDRSLKRDKIQSARKVRDCSDTKYPPERDKVCTIYSKKLRPKSRQQTTTATTIRPSYTSLKTKNYDTAKDESWGQLLKNSNKHSTFSKFDPLRTLHFLIKELECRIKNDIPGKYFIHLNRNIISFAVCRCTFTTNSA